MPKRKGFLRGMVIHGRDSRRAAVGKELQAQEEGDWEASDAPAGRRVEEGALTRYGLSRAPTEDRTPDVTLPEPVEIEGVLVLPPDGHRVDTSWHDEFCRILAASGMMREACLLVGVSLATVRKHRQRFPAFDTKVQAATEEAVELLFQVGWEMAVEWRDPDMIKHYQKALDPRFATRKIVEHQLSAQDRRLIEQQAKAAGVDPQRVFARLQGGSAAPPPPEEAS